MSGEQVFVILPWFIVHLHSDLKVSYLTVNIDKNRVCKKTRRPTVRVLCFLFCTTYMKCELCAIYYPTSLRQRLWSYPSSLQKLQIHKMWIRSICILLWSVLRWWNLLAVYKLLSLISFLFFNTLDWKSSSWSRWQHQAVWLR